MSTVLKVLLVALFVLMMPITLMCAYDAVIALTDEAPTFLFSFVLPMLQEEFVGGGRFASLAASLMLPGIGLLLPVVVAVLGILTTKRCDLSSRWRCFAVACVIVGGISFCMDVCSVFAIYRAYAAI